MPETGARYELRVFAHDLGIVEETMRNRARVARYREGAEVYIMSTANDENNTKVRDGLMDIKVLAHRERGLEQWSPRMKGGFPLPADRIRDEVFSAFGAAVPELERESYSFEQTLSEIIAPHPELAAVNVFKQRFAYDLEGCIAELANVYINGAAMRTACLESTDPDLVLEMRNQMHLDHYPNVNYLLAIKRVIGMAPLPDGVFYRAF